jgi:hypothetical protein
VKLARTAVLGSVLAATAVFASPALAASNTTQPTLLSVEYATDYSHPSETWVLGCGPQFGSDGSYGTHPNAKAACDLLNSAEGDLFAPLDKKDPRLCPAPIHPDYQHARVVGLWRGQRVDTTFIRTDLCEISRSNRVRPLIEPPAVH